MSFQEWSEEIARHKRTLRYKPETLYISTACYSDNTKQMLEELRERIGASKGNPYLTPNWELADDPCWASTITDWIREQQKKLYPYITELELSHNFTDNPYCIIKLDNEKEKENMEAKKCERCGKLYEAQDAENYITAYFPGLLVSDYSKENFSESRIRKDNTRIVSVNVRGGLFVDLCPECREKLKNFFESGKDETTVIKKAEE